MAGGADCMMRTSAPPRNGDLFTDGKYSHDGK
jgi:hypothetical protein